LDEIRLRIKKAEKFVEDAKNEFKMGLYERCCSTAYYAMLHASKAMIFIKGLYIWSGKIERNLV